MMDWDFSGENQGSESQPDKSFGSSVKLKLHMFQAELPSQEPSISGRYAPLSDKFYLGVITPAADRKA